MYRDPSGCFAILSSLLFSIASGVAFQTAVSTLSYVGMAVASIFDEDVRGDMDAIGWNPFNEDTKKVSNAKHVSFYKGAPVFIIQESSSSISFGAIGLGSHHKDGEDVLKHERGHNTQLMTMGLIKYGIFVGIPSPLKNDTSSPWELSATLLGGSNLRIGEATQQDKINALKYYVRSVSNNPISWLINLKNAIEY